MENSSQQRSASGSRRSNWLLLLAVVSTLVWNIGCVGTARPKSEAIPVRRVPDEVLGQPRCELSPIPLTLLRQPEPDQYRVDRGDVLTVYAEDVLGVRGQIPVQANSNPLAPKPAAQGYPLTVQDDGTIQIPEVPPIPVSGMTFNEVRAAIVKAITVDKKLIVPGKERVTVDLLQPRRYRVLVLREDLPDSSGVGEGRKVSSQSLLLEAYHNDLLEALTRTGGLPGPTSRNEVVIRRGQSRGGEGDATIRIPTKVRQSELVAIPPADIILGDGDTVLVEARDAEFYTVANGPGAGKYPLPGDTDLRIVDAIARSINPAPASGIAIVQRDLGSRRQFSIRVDIREALRDPRENILIFPGDIIILTGCGLR